jgi:DeoR/GlpR family transcriptional regulator of sugar metabolism
VRELIKGLPKHLSPWIDEDKLLIGDDIRWTLESTIRDTTDYVVLLVDSLALESAWVAKEVAWALEVERAEGRTLLLPVIVEQVSLEREPFSRLAKKRHLQLRDNTERSVRALAHDLAMELFALTCRDLKKARASRGQTPLRTLEDADAFLQARVERIQRIVFPHHKDNPIPLEKVLELLNEGDWPPLSQDEFDQLLDRVHHQHLVPGLRFDLSEVYLVEEHARWKGRIEHRKKALIGQKAATLIENGSRVFIDAGSTTDELVKAICKMVETRTLTRLTIGTTSAKIAGTISKCCVDMGFVDDFTAVDLFVPGGRVRPNTQAIVPSFGPDLRQIEMMAAMLEGFDMCFVGVNAVGVDGTLMTHSTREVDNKAGMLTASAARYVLGDSSKIGLSLPAPFARLGSGIRLIVDKEPDNRGLDLLLSQYGDDVVLA